MRIIWVTGARGGLGTTTLAALLAEHYAQRHATILIDFANGCLDVALGIETEPGMRWPDVDAGPDEAVVWSLPRWGQVEVLAGAKPTGPVSVDWSRDVVVMDGGLQPMPPGVGGVQVLLVGNDVLSLARAAGNDVARAGPTALVVRACPGGGLGGGEIEQVLGLDVVAHWRADVGLAKSSEAGLGPVASAQTRHALRRVTASLRGMP